MVRKVIAVLCLAILFAPGCVKKEKYPMPEKNLTPDQEEKIFRMLNNKSKVPQLNKELLDMGELAVPVILEKIYKLNKKLCNKTGYGRDERVTMSCDEGNLIIALGAIKSKKAVPAQRSKLRLRKALLICVISGPIGGRKTRTIFTKADKRARR